MLFSFFISFLLTVVNGFYDCSIHGVQVPNENLCLWPLNDLMFSFPDAEALGGSKLGGNAIRIDSVFVNAVATSLIKQSLSVGTSWIGVQKMNGTWKWTDGTALPYQNWAKGQPKDGDDLNCARMDGDAGTWSTSPCDGENQLICSFPINRTDSVSTTPGIRDSTENTQKTNVTTTNPTIHAYPSADNILFLFDVESLRDNSYIEDLKATLEALMRNWTNFERIAIATYTDKYYEKVYYGDITSYREALTWIDGIKSQSNSPDITSAMRRAPLSFQLTTTYTGKQKTVLIARTADGDDIALARPYAQALRDMGKVIVVAVEFTTESLAALASDDAAFEWDDPQNPYPLIDFLDTQLSQ